MKIYIAASSAEMPRAIDAIAACESAGFVVTCTWPTVVANTAGGANPRDATVGERKGWSKQDLSEISDSDAVWFLVPELPATTRGAWFEVGFAHAASKDIVFSGDTKQSVFCALGEEFASDGAALEYLTRSRA